MLFTGAAHRFAGREARLKTSRLANLKRSATHRARPRTSHNAVRARTARACDADAASAGTDCSSAQLLTALSYRSVLERGFALVRDEDGAPLHAAAGIAEGARLSIEFSDGLIAATANGEPRVSLAPAPKAAPTQRPAKAERNIKSQGDLF